MNTAKKKVFIEQFDKSAAYAGLKKFSCGDTIIDKYARENFKKDGQRDNKIVFVLVEDSSKDEEADVVEHSFMGFFTLQNFSMAMDKTARELFKRPDFFGYSLPPLVSTLKLFMIGVDKKYQKQPERWGSQLLLAAFEKSLAIADVSTDIKAIVLDASPDAVGFYTRHRFVALQDEPDENGTIPMVLPIHHLKAARDRACRAEPAQSTSVSDSK